MRKLLGLSLIAVGMTGLAFGLQNGKNGNNGNNRNPGSNKAPEINPSQAISALALLSGGVLILRRKR